jgi:hypothetical protein
VASNINDTVPAEGAAFTADMRANFAAAKAEIESLQAALALPVAVSVAQFVTLAELADARAGSLSFNASVPIQAAIDAAFAVSSTSYRVPVVVPQGKWKLETQIIVKAGIDLITQGQLVNMLASATAPCIWYKNDSAGSVLNLDANGQGGIKDHH